MKYFKILLFLFVMVVISSCTDTQYKLSKEDVYNLVNSAINGSKSASDSLKNIVSDNNYNLVEVFEHNAFNRTYFFILLNHSNSIHNRFAIFDDKLNLVLVDKSLNGKMHFNILNNKNKIYVNILENFSSKDILKLTRMSLYQLNNLSANLVFRTFLKFEKPEATYYQSILKLDENEIITSIASSDSLINDEDKFLFDNSIKQYVSNRVVFDNFIIREISSYHYPPEKPQIPASEGNDTLSIFINNIYKYFGFSLSIDKDWNFVETTGHKNFKKPMVGYIFKNNSIKTNIYVFDVSQLSSLNNFINYKLDNTLNGKYEVNFSSKIEAGENYLQFFQFRCKEKKYLLIFEPSRQEYLNNKKYLENLINSFTINC